MRLLLASVVVLLPLPACDIHVGDTNGPLSGTWRYRAVTVPAKARPGRAASGLERRTLTSARVHGEIRGGKLHLVVESTLHSTGPVAGDRVHGQARMYGWGGSQPEAPE